MDTDTVEHARTFEIVSKERPQAETIFAWFPSLTDLGNAERFAYFRRADCRYCQPFNSWLVYDGTRWRQDDRCEIVSKGKDTIRQLYGELGRIADDRLRADIAKHLARSESDSKLRGMLHLAQSELSVVPDELDAMPDFLNCENGTLHLPTGTLNPHMPDDLLTKRVNAPYLPDAECPRFDAFMDEITAGKLEAQAFLQRTLGYSLSGDNSEQCLFMPYGRGQNGKSTLLGVVQDILGDYAESLPPEELLIKRQETAIPCNIARTRGARFVTSIETEKGKRLAESLVKGITGNDAIVACLKYQNPFTFRPVFKLWFAVNDRPIIRGTDFAIWRRIHLIPFEVTIAPDRQDKKLKAKLRDEWPGILAWLVRGYRDYQLHGLAVPEAVTKATAGYRADMDVLADFLQERCVLADSASVRAGDLWTAYEKWCAENGEKGLPNTRSLGIALLERGFQRSRDSRSRIWLGIGLHDGV